jgi:putative transposase
LSRSSFYYRESPVSEEELQLRLNIDQIHLEKPFYGSRKIAIELERKNFATSRDRVRRLMKEMGIEAIYRKPRTSIPKAGNQIYPYLLKDLVIDRPNQVWTSDITYIPMARGFCFLVAILDLMSRKVLAWRLSNTQDASFCADALEEAVDKYGAPEIFNTDQGSQFTSEAFVGKLKENNIKISMDGKGRWIDNVFIERVWRSIKYEEVYLKAYENLKEARLSLNDYINFYNRNRIHQSLDYMTPDEVYYYQPLRRLAA